MNEIIYFDIKTSKPLFYREDSEVIFVYPTSKPYATIDTEDNNNVWYDYKKLHPIAFEDDQTVYDWDTHKPIYFIEKD